MILSILLFLQISIAHAQTTIPNQSLWEDARADAQGFISHWGEFFVWKSTYAPESNSGPDMIQATKAQLEIIKKRSACLKVYFSSEMNIPEIDFCTIIVDESEWARWEEILNDPAAKKDHNSKQEPFLQRAMNWLSKVTDVKSWTLKHNAHVQRDQRLFELLSRER